MTTSNPGTNTDNTPSVTEDSDPYRLLVSAQVTIIESSGTSVPTPSMGHAIRLIRTRYHAASPIVALAAQHTNDPLFAGAPAGWLVLDSSIHPIDADTLPSDPDYLLAYHAFALSDPNAPDTPSTPCKPDALATVAARAADSADQPVHLDSRILGFSRPTFQPGDSSKTNVTGTAEAGSVLDSLDLAVDHDPLDGAAAVLVHPSQPSRDGNYLTVPHITGVTYNVDPGEYPITGEGVTVTAEPSDGYTFPEDIESTWDFEYVPEAQTASSVHTLMGPHEDTASEDAAATDAAAHHVLLGAATPLWKRRTPRIAAAASLMAILALSGGALTNSNEGATDPDQAQEDSFAGVQWPSTVPTPTRTDQSLTEDHTITLWDLDADLARALSWYSAGVAYIDPDDESLVLLDTLSGVEIASTDLDSPVQWTTEFMVGDTPAVGARTDNSFKAITSGGATQTWNIDEASSLRVSGSTPMLTTDSGDIYALVMGEDDPVEITGNPNYRPAAIDAEMLIQFAAGIPRLVTLPVTESADHEAAEVTLESPTDDASFSRHLSVGHGLTLSEWDIDGANHLVVHDLQNDATVTAVVPAAEHSQAWTIGHGMDLAIVGPYAFDLDTGELITQSEAGPIEAALGPVAITQHSEGRRFTLDGQQFGEDSRIIGYTGKGTALIRNPDGSVAAVSESTGMA